ncbi:hypothetical protein CCM_07066 [Cordyceps militaris CM01]|uniref:Uncharacterized protein n=1 Tax=Cordyceps militaris (strain CM01) TaxID=983644 RepID=G3JLS2_CORMM|nr:uncharacterized protein CCM_07066 [Cordyceps militaris CM01]EGX90646.1 hypothetical protein CCM_07066 [Cordyceps militaris CM01]
MGLATKGIGQRLTGPRVVAGKAIRVHISKVAGQGRVTIDVAAGVMLRRRPIQRLCCGGLGKLMYLLIALFFVIKVSIVNIVGIVIIVVLASILSTFNPVLNFDASKAGAAASTCAGTAIFGGAGEDVSNSRADQPVAGLDATGACACACDCVFACACNAFADLDAIRSVAVDNGTEIARLRDDGGVSGRGSRPGSGGEAASEREQRELNGEHCIQLKR